MLYIIPVPLNGKITFNILHWILIGFMKLHMSLVVLVKKMTVLINFLLQNTNRVSVLSKIFPNFADHV